MPTDDFDPTKPPSAAPSRQADDFDPTKPPGGEPNPVERRVREATHQVLQDFRQQAAAPKTVKEAVAQMGRRAAGPIGAVQTAMDLQNVPAAFVGGGVELGGQAAKARTPTTAGGLPQLPGWLSTALDSFNPALKPAAQMAIMKPKLAGDVAQAVAPGPEGVAAEAIGAGAKLARAAKLAGEMKITIPEARALIAAGKVPPKFALGADRTEREASRQILQRVRSDTSGKGAPTATEILEHAAGLPRENLTVMDTAGQRTKGYAGMIARGPRGSGGGTLRRFFRGTEIRPGSGRSAQLKPEMIAETQHNLGAGSSHQTIDALEAHQKEQSSAIYKQAFDANTRMPNSVFDEWKRDRKLGPLYRQAFDDVVARYKGSGKVYTDKDSLEVYDAFKRKLWKASQAAKRMGDTNLADMFAGKYKQLVGELDAMDKTGLYAKARKVWGGEQESMDAVEFGRDEVLKLSPYEIGKRFRGLSDNNKELARLGLAETIRNRIAKSGTRNPAAFLAHDEYLKDQIRQMFKSPQEAERFFDAATAKDLQWNTAAEVLGGSQTAERLGEDAAGMAETVGHGAAAVAAGAKGNPLSVIYHGRRMLGDLARRPRGEVGERAAEILTQRLNAPDSASRKILERRALEQAALDLVKRNPPFLKRFDMTRGLGKGVPLAVQQGVATVSPQDQ